ncbi:MAG: ribonuclease E activity regulator RraA [Brachymonas denitrificans]|jgi:regulator of ribonuclease activity A|uniref:ribonuclease E activity regulator RraA n=1 Tax=Brachymonas denitrificans TaxID=28220 RepID=UPI002AFE527E|nr:ribonuclease E activity regulator RraA [Brachymonas denitrificans]
MTQATFATCDFCDPHRDGVPPGFAVLPPVFRNYASSAPFSGQVVTVQCFEDNTTVKSVLETEGKGRVLVVAGAGSLRTALVGGNIGKLVEKNGWAGVVVDGCVRDVRELAPLQVGIRALASMPMPPMKRQEGLVDVPVHVQGVVVRPGDWLYADDDGIVVSDKPLC